MTGVHCQHPECSLSPKHKGNGAFSAGAARKKKQMKRDNSIKMKLEEKQEKRTMSGQSVYLSAASWSASALSASDAARILLGSKKTETGSLIKLASGDKLSVNMGN